MPILKPAGEAQFLFEISGKEISVLEFSARERMSIPFEVELTLAAEDEITFDEVIGKEALLTILGEHADRYFHGIVNRFVQTGSIGRYFIFRATVVPALWMLSLEQDCRIFQKKKTPDIVKMILQEGGIPDDRFEFRLIGTYEPREYCVQYRETDLNFISRLLEEEGIFYFFEHKEDKHLLVFGDSDICYQPIAAEPAISFNPSDGLAPEAEFVKTFTLSRDIRSGKVTMRDFNFEKPSQDLTSDDKEGKYQGLEVYDYPGVYLESGTGKRLAKIRLQERTMFTERAEGESICPRFLPGFWFTLKDHEMTSLNRGYFLVEVFHTGSQPQVLGEQASDTFHYANRFFGIPSSVIFRPERVSAKPIVEGVQTAIVVGPKEEEIYTDGHGRVKVQFHWDRMGRYDEQSSCWIRVSQLWAGAGWGAMFIPRIGHEVIVDFVEGDPDRPIITGRVYHGSNTPPYPLPDEKNKSTIKSDSTIGGGGSNEIRFDDTKDSEEFYTHAQKNQNEVVENNMSTSVGANQSVSVGANQSITVSSNRSKTVGANQSETIGANKTIHVGVDHEETIGASMSLKVGADKKIKVDGSHTESIDDNMYLTVGKSKTETVAIASAETVGAGKALSVGGVYQVSVGGAMNTTVILGQMEEIGLLKKTVVGSKYELECDPCKIVADSDGKIVIKCGASKITLEKSGKVSIEGKEFNFTADGPVKINGKPIDLN